MAKKIYYDDTTVLVNKFGLKDQEKLNVIERLYTAVALAKLKESPIKGQFDIKHLQEIHKSIFKDVYEWAGKTRNYDISKGTQFCPLQNLDSYQTEIFSSLKKENYLKGLDIDQFSKRAAYYLGEINMLHPFLEGNGRTQREFIRELAFNAGYELSIDNREPGFKEKMINASIRSANGYNDGFEKIMRENIRAIALYQEFIHSLKKTPSINELPKDPLLKNLYDSYAKDVLAESNNTWTDKTNYLIAEKMLQNGISSSRVVASFKHSPEKVDKPYSLIKTIENKPEVRALQKNRGMEF